MTNRRGFARERHTEWKLLVTFVTLVGFGAGWVGFGYANDPVTAAPTAIPATTATAETRTRPLDVTPTPHLPVATPSVPAPTATAPAANETTGPLRSPTPKKRSRGS